MADLDRHLGVEAQARGEAAMGSGTGQMAGVAALIAWFGPGGPAPAAARTDVPIRQVAMPDGPVRYAVPVTIGGGAPIEAELDTGSFGLRVLKAAVKPGSYAPTGERRSAAFSGGEKLDGFLARATVGAGTAATRDPALVMVIEHASCMAARPNCYAARVKPEDYRISGNGGFEAILGTSLRQPASGDGAANPLPLMGGGSWIVSLPQPGSREPGHLIIDPDPGERAGFTEIHLKAETDVSTRWSGWADTVLPGCLLGTAGQATLCAETVLDTGYPGFSIGTSDVAEPRPYGAGKSVTFEIGGENGPVSIPFITGRDSGSRVFLHPLGDGGQAKIIAGPLPFLSYDVLYDATNGVIGFRRRQPPAPQ